VQTGVHSRLQAAASHNTQTDPSAAKQPTLQ